MSYEKQPEPVLPNYNPSAWDSPLSAEEQEVLDAYYVKFPIAQNAPITLPNQTTIGTVKTNTINSTSTLKINETNGIQTAINSGNISANTLTLGSIGTTTHYIRGTINLNEEGNGNTVIGKIGATGSITVNRPLTIGYTYNYLNDTPANATKLGAFTTTLSYFKFPTATTIKSFAPINGLPNGLYLVNTYVFFGGATDVGGIEFNLATSNLAITDGSTSPVNGVYTGTIPGFGTKPNLTNSFSMGTTGTIGIFAPFNNIALSLLTTTAMPSTDKVVVELSVFRLG
jgi:hypothetical protein